MTTATEIQTRLDAYRAAELRILEGGQESESSSGPDGRRTKRADLGRIQDTIKTLEKDLALALQRESGQGRRVVNPAPTW